MKMPGEVREYFRRQGKIGAKKRHANLTPERRREIARAAARARWKQKDQDESTRGMK